MISEVEFEKLIQQELGSSVETINTGKQMAKYLKILRFVCFPQFWEALFTTLP